VLALIQTRKIVGALQRLFPDQEFEIQTVKTLGDRVVDVPLSQFGSTGVFVKEIDRLLLDGAIDLAVHSLKDVPPDETPGVALTAFPERADPRDALVSRVGQSFEGLPPEARVGTSSVRRQAQLRAVRPNLTYCDDLRGNVDTRLRKLAEGQYDAIILAVAGLERLGRAAEISERLPTELCLPDAGQGILAVATRADDAETVAIVSRLDDPVVRATALAERAMLRSFGGGCKVPVAAYARVVELADDAAWKAALPVLHLTGLVASVDGTRLIRAEASASLTESDKLGALVWQKLVDDGALAILQETTHG